MVYVQHRSKIKDNDNTKPDDPSLTSTPSGIKYNHLMNLRILGPVNMLKVNETF